MLLTWNGARAGACGVDLDTDPLDRMKRLEDHLALMTPRTPEFARQLLGICITILSHPEPEEHLGKGPILEIIKNVKDALVWLPAETRFQKAAKSESA
jgi:hypothetical protein